MDAANQPVVFLRIVIRDEPAEVLSENLPIEAHKELLRRQARDTQKLSLPRDSGIADLPRCHLHPSSSNCAPIVANGGRNCPARSEEQRGSMRGLDDLFALRKF